MKKYAYRVETDTGVVLSFADDFLELLTNLRAVSKAEESFKPANIERIDRLDFAVFDKMREEAIASEEIKPEEFSDEVREQVHRLAKLLEAEVSRLCNSFTKH